MFNKKRFELMSKSLDAVNAENAKLKNKNLGLESMVQRQSRTIERLQDQLDNADTDKSLAKKNRELAKKVNALEFVISQYQKKLKLVREKVRHVFEMSSDEIKV